MKKFICGAITGAVIATAVGVGAVGVWDTIPVLKNDIKVIVNGNEVADDNFLYNDTTYIPLRAVSSALGENVEYDEAENTAYIGERKDNMDNTEVKNKYIPEENDMQRWMFIREKDNVYYISIGYIAEVMNAQNFNRSDFYGENANNVQQLIVGNKSWDVARINGDICVPYDTYVDEIEPLLK